MKFNCTYKYFVRYLLPILIWCSIIFYLSSIPLVGKPVGIRISDKLLHTVEYFPLAFLLLRAFYNSRFKIGAYWFGILFTILYGISDEVHQLFVPGRIFSLLDILFDSLGGSMIIIFNYFNKKFRRFLFFDFDKFKK